MNDQELSRIREMLRASLPPSRQELARDLWPAMLQHLQKSPAPVPWFDWALLAFSAAAAYFFPALIPTLFYHL